MSDGPDGAPRRIDLLRLYRRQCGRWFASWGAPSDAIDDLLGRLALRLAEADERGLPPVESPRGFLKATCRHLFSDWAAERERQRKREGHSLEDGWHRAVRDGALYDAGGRLAASAIFPDRDIDRRKAERDDLLERLPPRERALALLLLEGRSPQEIAELADTTARRIRELASAPGRRDARPRRRWQGPPIFATREHAPSFLRDLAQGDWWRCHPGRHGSIEERIEAFLVHHVRPEEISLDAIENRRDPGTDYRGFADLEDGGDERS